MVAEDATEREEQEALLFDVRDFERTLHAVLLGEQPPKARRSGREGILIALLSLRTLPT